MTDRGALDFADEGRFLERRLRGWTDQAVSNTPGAAVARNVAGSFPRTARLGWLAMPSRRLVWLGLAAAVLLATAAATILLAPFGHRPIGSTRPLVVVSAGQIVAVDVATGTSRQIGPGGAPRLSPDGSMVSFLSTEGLGVMAVDGTGRRFLAQSTDCQLGPWSRDGLAVLTACRQESGAAPILVFRVDSFDVRPLGRLATYKDFGLGSWSPEGTRIVLPIGGNSLVVATGTGPATQMKTIVEAGRPWLPRWSPDGSWIAYAAGAIHVVQPDGTGDRVLVERANPCELAWSPDSRALAFTAPYGGCPVGSAQDDARIVGLDGTAHTIASPVAGQEIVDLAWSSDGRLALVVGPSLQCSPDESHRSVWLVDADGSNPRKVVDSVDCEWPDLGGPDW